MNYKEIKTLKGQVKYCLEEYPETRNSDITLTIAIWKVFFPQHLFKVDGLRETDGVQQAILLKNLFELPREDNIKRVRAHFQNDKKILLPTVWEVAKGRGIAEDEWRVAMGYPTRITSGTETPSWVPPSEVKGEEVQNTLV